MSLLPIIRIKEFLEEEFSDGTTRPMLVLGEDGKKYVLKIFSKRDAAQRPYVAAEVLANLLAKQFNLFVPSAAYLTIDNALLDFVENNQPKINEVLQLKHTDGIHFGTEYHPGLPMFTPSKNDKLLELDEYESILAFDTLIANEDRKKHKPNILRGEKNYLLIDHEKAFEGLECIYTNVNNGILPNFFSYHIFYKRLRVLAKTKSEEINFETFEDFFRLISFVEIEENIRFLIQNGCDESKCYEWLFYIKKQKENCTNFVTLLNRKIRE